MFEALGQDIRYALRRLRHQPAFTLVVILSLTCGIGANTAVFSVVNALLLKSLPVRAANELVQFDSANSQNVNTLQGFSYQGFEILRKASSPVLDGLFAYAANDTSSSVSSVLQKSILVHRGNAAVASGLMASANMYFVLGVQPSLGRLFVADDDRIAGGSPVLVLSYGYWQARFGGARSIIGSAVSVNNISFTVIGVTPPEFRGLEFGSIPDFTVPLSMAEALKMGGLHNGANWWLGIIGRRKPGFSNSQIERQLQPAFRQSVNDLLQSVPAAMMPDTRKMVSGLKQA